MLLVSILAVRLHTERRGQTKLATPRHPAPGLQNLGGLRKMRIQGRRLRQDEIARIVSLLRETDMSLAEISKRMQCSRAVIVGINRKYSVRDYGGKRVTWKLIERNDGSARTDAGHRPAA